MYDGIRYEVNLWIQGDQKANVMPIITASNVDEWRRQQMLGHTELEGKWAQRLYTDFDYYEDGNRLTVRFVFSVQEGDDVNGCTIKRVEKTGSTLVIACDSPAT